MSASNDSRGSWDSGHSGLRIRSEESIFTVKLHMTLPARRKFPTSDALVVHLAGGEEGGDSSTVAGTRLMEAVIQVRFLCWTAKPTDGS